MSAKNGVDKKCTICSKEYYIRANRAAASKYCSKECWSKRRKLNDCEYCKKPITSYHGKKYCSRGCSHSAMVGDKAPTWIDGKSLERDRARLGSQIKVWRKDVFNRDAYTCQHCGTKRGLQAHHIIEWAKDEAKRFDVDNGLTLCIDCHGKVHGRDFTKRNNKKCIDCGERVKMAGTACHSCSAKRQHAKRRMLKLDPTLEIKKNGQPYTPIQITPE